ncbi:hypothetical protein GCM10029964_077860 [Kibdelosporangium lantanae]
MGSSGDRRGLGGDQLAKGCGRLRLTVVEFEDGGREGRRDRTLTRTSTSDMSARRTASVSSCAQRPAWNPAGAGTLLHSPSVHSGLIGRTAGTRPSTNCSST